MGIDGFRVDTVYYTPEDFYEGFLYDKDPESPGVKRFAEKKGIKDFFVFGEVWCYDYAAINRYLKDGRTVRLDSAIDLPLNEVLSKVFFRKGPTDELREVLGARRHNRNLWVNFLDNHDVERINSRAGRPAVRQSLAALFTLPGIPCVTYGTEAGFKAARQNMFRDECCDKRSEHFAFLKEMIDFRKRHPALRRGRCKVERTSPAAGVLAYSVFHENERYLMVFNTSADRMFHDPGFRGRAEARVLLSSEKRKTVSGPMILGPDSYLVLRTRTRKAARAKKARPPVRRRPRQGRHAGRPLVVRWRPVRMSALPGKTRKGKIAIDFKVREPKKVSTLWLLADDDYDARLRVPDPASGRYELDTAGLGNGRHRIALLAKTKSGALAASNEVFLNVANDYRLIARAAVPEEGRAGVARKLHAPGDPSYDRQVSMEEVSILTSGKDLRIKIRMSNVTDDWNPPNGYDHVYFSVFFDFPGRPGKRFFPKLDYGRDDFEFNAGFLLYGWGAVSFGADDSTQDAYGSPLIGEAAQHADLKGGTISFTLSKKIFDALETFAGTKVFLSTWDGYLADLRPVSDKKEEWSFYALDGKDAKGLPKVFDHVIIRL
ncbi:MAG: alpha-amylase family glycosyl hydrolase [Elusimicrobiota bacterium]